MVTPTPDLTIHAALAAVMAEINHVGKDGWNEHQRAAVITAARKENRYKHLPTFWHRVMVGHPDDCWDWLGAIGTHRYGALSEGQLAHRKAYELLIGPIPADLTVDHLCLNRACCNPMHMEIVTREENARRGQSNRKVRSGGRWMADRTHCVNNHEFRDGSYRMVKGTRVCRACAADRKARFLARRAGGQ